MTFGEDGGAGGESVNSKNNIGSSLVLQEENEALDKCFVILSTTVTFSGDTCIKKHVSMLVAFSSARVN